MFLTAAFYCTLFATVASQSLEIGQVGSGNESPVILQLVSEQNMLQGTYLIGGKNSDLQIEFLAQIQGNRIVSFTSFYRVSTDYRTQVTTLRLPLKSLHHRKVKNIHQLILQSAYETEKVLRIQVENLPPLVKVESIYQDMANALAKATTQLGQSQLRFSVMYHTSIVASARRIIKGATDPDDICTVDPKYIYGDTLFMCLQDLLDLLGITQREFENRRSQFSQVQRDEQLPSIPEESNAHRHKREYHPCCSWPPSGRHWGCCANYGGRCYFALVECWMHDCVCQCCLDGHWSCLSGCIPESYCSATGSFRYSC